MPINIIPGDCNDGMKKTPDKFYDLAVVDPPYGIDVANMNMGIGKGKKCSKIENRKWVPKNWDKEIPSPEYFSELFRISKNQIIWGGNYFEIPPCYGYIIWDKGIPEGLSFSACEMAWHSFKKAPRIFKYSAYKEKKIKVHPTQKPVALYKWLLKNYAKPGNEILDTHLGSGSIAIACHDMGFNLTAYEIDKDYYNAALKRLKLHQSQLTLL